MQVGLQQLKLHKPVEGRKREEKERYLIGDSTIDRDDSSWPENHWEIKSTELRRLKDQVSR